MKQSITLFSPIKINSLKLKNRLVALPIYTGYAHSDGRASSLLIDHYSKIANSGVAMVVVANGAISSDGILAKHNLRVDGDEFIPGLRQLAEAIKQKGALACLQLNHGGRFAKTDQPLLPSSIDGTNLTFNISSLKNFMDFFPLEQRLGWTRYLLKQATKWRRAMSAVDIGRVIRGFGQAAFRAYQAGFDMVELHGANGYLLCQFLSSFTNRGETDFENDFRDRAAIPIAIIREIKNKVSEDFPVGFRLLLREWVPSGINFPEAVAFARLLQKEKIAYLSASVGSYNSIFSSEVVKKMDQIAYLREDMKTLTNQIDVPTIISGRIIKPSIAEEIIKDGAADLIGLGRPLRTDITWVNKAYDKQRKVVTCINCNQCLKRVVMDQGFVCSLWPKKNQERIHLEHRLLTMNYKELWVIENTRDLILFKAALPNLFPDKSKLTVSILPTLFFLSEHRKNDLPKSVRDSFLKWCKEMLNRQGYCDTVLQEKHYSSKDSLDKVVRSEIKQGDHGIILIGRNRNQPWRERLMYQERGKVVVLLGSNRFYTRILVPVDLSETTLLVLMLMRQVYIDRSGFNIQFIHILRDSEDLVKKRWQDLLKIVGFDKEHELKLISTDGDVADEILKTVKKDNHGTIVMGKRGISGIKRWMLGSVSARVLRGLEDQSLLLID